MADRSPAEEIVTYPFGAPEPPARPPRRAWRALAGVTVAVVLLAVAGSIVFFAHSHARSGFAVGDCATYRPGTEQIYEEADCGDAGAGYVVLAVDSDEDCSVVPGAEASIETDGQRLCFGKKGVDPATAPNGAQKGDCLTADEDHRVLCTSSDAYYLVSDRMTDVSVSDARKTCGEDGLLGWDWSNVDGGSSQPTRYDLALCLVKL